MTTSLTSVNKEASYLIITHFLSYFFHETDKPSSLQFTVFRSTTCVQLTQLRDLDAHWYTETGDRFRSFRSFIRYHTHALLVQLREGISMLSNNGKTLP